MKICVPSMLPGGLMARLSSTFIGAPCYTLIEFYGDGKKGVEVVSNPAPGDPSLPAKLMAMGVSTVLIGQVAPELLSSMWQCNIRAFVGAFGTVDDAVNVYKSGTLAEAYIDQDIFEEEEE